MYEIDGYSLFRRTDGGNSYVNKRRDFRIFYLTIDPPSIFFKESMQYQTTNSALHKKLKKYTKLLAKKSTIGEICDTFLTSLRLNDSVSSPIGVRVAELEDRVAEYRRERDSLQERYNLTKDVFLTQLLSDTDKKIDSLAKQIEKEQEKLSRKRDGEDDQSDPMLTEHMELMRNIIALRKELSDDPSETIKKLKDEMETLRERKRRKEDREEVERSEKDSKDSEARREWETRQGKKQLSNWTYRITKQPIAVGSHQDVSTIKDVIYNVLKIVVGKKWHTSPYSGNRYDVDIDHTGIMRFYALKEFVNVPNSKIPCELYLIDFGENNLSFFEMYVSGKKSEQTRYDEWKFMRIKNLPNLLGLKDQGGIDGYTWTIKSGEDMVSHLDKVSR